MHNRHRIIDFAIVGLLGPIWLFNMATGVLNPKLQIPIYVDTWVTQGYPEVRGYKGDASSADTVLRVGDRILSIGGEDALQVGQPGVMAMIYGANHAATSAGGVPRVMFEVERNGERLLVSDNFVGSHEFAMAVQSLVYGFAAILILIRAPVSSGSRALFYALFAYSMLYSAAPTTSAFQASLAMATATIAIVFTQPLLIRAFMSFPQEASMLHGVHRWWPLLFASIGLLVTSGRYGFPFPPDVTALPTLVGVLIYILTLVVVITINYRNSSPGGKRQIKWVLYGVYLGSLAALTVYLARGATPMDSPWWWSAGIAFASCSFPIAVLIAVLRFDMLDIDRVIGTTAMYNVLLVGLAGAVFVVAPRISQAASGMLGMDPNAGQVVFALLLAALLLYFVRSVRPYLDRIFFKERVALEKGIRDIEQRLVVARTPEDLWETTGADLVRLLRPASCAIYTSAGESFVPVFARGRSIPAAIPKNSGLLEWFGSLESAVLVRTATLRRLAGVDKAIMESLQAQTVIPIFRGQQFEAVLCLGEKHSGDIYTSTDLALLSSMANGLSTHLLRFDQTELLERTRATQDAMRKYVPGAIADEIDRGSTMAEGEREVSVLFVDIRGYTNFAIKHDAEAIFSTVNRYTERVSQIVRDHGGSVVEFNGDGMMAVFGAPNSLPDMEQAALRAGRALITGVAQLALAHEATALNVGVGIATGPAFVGNIHAVDRFIWSAIGNTTNMAARLQNLTRDLHASVIVDSATRQAAGTSADDLVETNANIRGRAGDDTVYLLPL